MVTGHEGSPSGSGASLLPASTPELQAAQEDAEYEDAGDVSEWLGSAKKVNLCCSAVCMPEPAFAALCGIVGQWLLSGLCDEMMALLLQPAESVSSQDAARAAEYTTVWSELSLRLALQNLLHGCAAAHFAVMPVRLPLCMPSRCSTGARLAAIVAASGCWKACFC